MLFFAPGFDGVKYSVKRPLDRTLVEQNPSSLNRFRSIPAVPARTDEGARA